MAILHSEVDGYECWPPKPRSAGRPNRAAPASTPSANREPSWSVSLVVLGAHGGQLHRLRGRAVRRRAWILASWPVTPRLADRPPSAATVQTALPTVRRPGAGRSAPIPLVRRFPQNRTRHGCAHPNLLTSSKLLKILLMTVTTNY